VLEKKIMHILKHFFVVLWQPVKLICLEKENEHEVCAHIKLIKKQHTHPHKIPAQW